MNRFGTCGILTAFLYTLMFAWDFLFIYLVVMGGYFVVSLLYVPLSSMKYNGTRRKIMISTWGDPATPELLIGTTLRLRETLEFLEKHATITLTHLVVKSLGEILKEFHDLNGKIVFGHFIPYSDLRVGLNEEISENGDYRTLLIGNVKEKKLLDIANECESRIQEERNKGKEEEFWGGFLPTFIAGPLVDLCELMNSCFALNLNFLGGSKLQAPGLVTNFGKYQGPVLYSPLNVGLKSSIIVNISSVTDSATLQETAIVIEKTAVLTATFDCRLIEGGRATQVIDRMRELLENPSKYF